MAARRRLRSGLDTLLYWVEERENIRLAKLAGAPPPWTEDEILQRFRFCNVRRIDDRVSQWLFNNVFGLLSQGMSRWTFIRMVALCRWVNWPPTLKNVLELDKPWHERRGVWKNWDNMVWLGDNIDLLCEVGTKTWTGAYMVRAPSKKKYPNMPKGRFVAEIVVGKGLDSIQGDLMEALETNYAQNVWEVLCRANNWGSFMAGQVVADLSYTPLLYGARDLLTWAPQGPGSRRGYNRILGRPIKQKIDDQEWSEQLQVWRGMVVDRLGGGNELTLHDVQNCLCEVDKYLRFMYGEGRPRSTYKPETAY